MKNLNQMNISLDIDWLHGARNLVFREKVEYRRTYQRYLHLHYKQQVPFVYCHESA
ncbi:hypothetical protein D3C79_1066610 [compost metagenome]